MKQAPSGRRCSSNHPKAVLTDAQVRAMRNRYVPGQVGYETLAKEFGCGVSTARDICNYATRVTA